MGKIRTTLAATLIAAPLAIAGAKATGLTDALVDAVDGGPENGGVEYVDLTSKADLDPSVFDVNNLGETGIHDLYVLVPTEEGNYQLFHGDDPSEVLAEVGGDAVLESDGQGTMFIGERENFVSVTFPLQSAEEFFDLDGQDMILD